MGQLQAKIDSICHYLNLNKADYQKLSSPQIGEKLRQVRSGLREITRSLEDYLKDADDFSFEKFELGFVQQCRFLKQRKRNSDFGIKLDDTFDFSIYESKFRILKEPGAAKDNLLGGYLSYIVALLRTKSVRTADIYQSSFYSLLAFGGNVKLKGITKQYLKEYDVWMRDNGKKKTTIGIYVRTLRKIFNNAIDDEILSRKQYPFDRNKYIIPSGRNTKKAINSAWLPAIYNYQPTHRSEHFARDTWFFLCFGNGMNPKDMACLRYKNIVGDCIVFERAKTITTVREDSKSINIYLTKELMEIIRRLPGRVSGFPGL